MANSFSIADLKAEQEEREEEDKRLAFAAIFGETPRFQLESTLGIASGNVHISALNPSAFSALMGL